MLFCRSLSSESLGLIWFCISKGLVECGTWGSGLEACNELGCVMLVLVDVNPTARSYMYKAKLRVLDIALKLCQTVQKVIYGSDVAKQGNVAKWATHESLLSFVRGSLQTVCCSNPWLSICDATVRHSKPI